MSILMAPSITWWIFIWFQRSITPCSYQIDIHKRLIYLSFLDCSLNDDTPDEFSFYLSFSLFRFLVFSRLYSLSFCLCRYWTLFISRVHSLKWETSVGWYGWASTFICTVFNNYIPIRFVRSYRFCVRTCCGRKMIFHIS